MTEQNNTLRAIMQALEIYPALKPLLKYKLNNEGIENVEITNETLRGTETIETANVPGIGTSTTGQVPYPSGTGNVPTECPPEGLSVDSPIDEVIFQDFNKRS